MAQAKRKEKLELVAETGPQGAQGGWAVPQSLSPKAWGVVAAVVVLINLPLIHYYLFRSQPEATLTVPYQNDFSSPDSVKSDFFSTGGLWRVVNGEVLAPGVKNNPLWLKAKLPQNVAVEFDAKSLSPEGDIKVEIFGDGSDHASGYVLVHGGWGNSLSIIARLDEHGVPFSQFQQDAQRIAKEKGLSSSGVVETGVYLPTARTRVEANPFRVEVGRTYHWRIERRGSVITWLIDGAQFMQFDDPIPLVGPKHDRFGFSSWEAQLYFDNLRIEPL